MEYFGVFGFVFALIVYFKAEKNSARIKKLEAILKEEGYVDREKQSLREILEKNVGRILKISLNEEAMVFDINDKECILEDIDEQWICLKTIKRQEEYLVRVESVEGVEFVND